jgi:hypothetical protein
MPLPAPILDDRAYQQLRDELVARIPVYAPEWTDYTESDPGVTVLELLAYLGENLLFRFNQIPESTYLAFLRLLDVPLLPAGVATGAVAFTTKSPTGELVAQQSEVLAGQIPFETQIEVTAWPVSLVGVCRAASSAPTDPDASAFAAQSVQALGLTGDQQPAYYVNKLLPADPSASDAAAVDFGEAVDGALWIAVLAEPGGEAGLPGGATLSIGYQPTDVAPPMGQQPASPGVGASPPAPPVLWQVSTGQRAADGSPVYRTLTPLADTTTGLTAPGVVRLGLPDPPDVGVFTATLDELQGTGEEPPVLDDESQAARVLFWIRATRPDRGPFGPVLWVGANATTIRQARAAAPEFVATGTGDHNQVYSLVNSPVIDDRELIVEVEDQPGQWNRWTQVDSLEASGPSDTFFVLDPESGTLHFGGPLQGLAPQIGRRIRARGYRYGGGSAGNVAAKGITRYDDNPNVKVSNPLPTAGGSESETVASALDRVPGEIRRHDRAVTASDFSELALQTPGGQVARAECLPRFHPHYPQVDPAAGVVSVIVWPRSDAQSPNAPMPDQRLLRAVCAELDPRRLVTTELYVIPPTYRKVAVAVGVNVKDGYGTDAVRRWVELVIRQYLAPVPPYGPDGLGWPLGRRVFGPELEAAALQVEGVDYLEGLNVAGLAGDGSWSPGTVTLERWEVPELAAISVVAGPPLDAGADVSPPTVVPAPVPVPVLKEQC